MAPNVKLATYEVINARIYVAIRAFANLIIWTDFMQFMHAIVMKGIMDTVVIYLIALMNAIIMVYASIAISVRVIEDLKV
jgi:hypothetical protein